MELSHTLRGFAIVNFEDIRGADCSLQKSSLESLDCIWFGQHEHRMHLTQGQVLTLLPFIRHFLERGDLCLEEQEGHFAGVQFLLGRNKEGGMEMKFNDHDREPCWMEMAEGMVAPTVCFSVLSQDTRALVEMYLDQATLQALLVFFERFASTGEIE